MLKRNQPPGQLEEQQQTPVKPPRTPVIEAGNTRFRVEEDPQNSSDRALNEDIKEIAKSYVEKYQNFYFAGNFQHDGIVRQDMFYAEICNLLFAIQNEIKELKEKIQ